MSVLGWVLFAVTIVVAVYQQLQAEKVYDDDLEAKREEWLAEKRNLQNVGDRQKRIIDLQMERMDDVRRAING